MSRVTIMHDDVGLFTGPSSAPLYETLEEVLAQVGEPPLRVVVAGPLSASADLSIPAHVTMEFTGEGALYVDAGKTVTILGHVLAPARQVFAGDGSVVFESDACVIFPGWWGSGEGVRIGKLATDQLEVTVLAAGLLQADSASIGAVSATTVSTTGNINAGNQVRAVEVYEGSMRVGTDRVAKSGDAMTGPLYLYSMPEGDLEAAPRSYVLDIFRSFQSTVEQTNGFGIIVIDGTNTLLAEAPMDVVSLVSGFGMTLVKGVPLYVVDSEPAEFDLVDDEGDAVGIGEKNGLIVSCNEAPATVALEAGDAVPCGARTVRVSGDGGAVDLTSDPQVAAGEFDGQPLLIVGGDDTNTVKLDDGTGLELVGGTSITLGKGDSLALRWDLDDTTWREVHRANV